MIIEPGKFYKTRAGEKARIYSDDNGECAVTRFHGAIYSVAARLWAQRGWSELGLIKNNDLLDEDDIIAEWTEPHPLANAKPGDVVWVRDMQCGPWGLAVFDALEENAAYPVFVRRTSDDESSSGWRFGKPYVPGEKP